MSYLELFCKYNTLIRILDYSDMKKLCRLSGTAKTARGVAAHGVVVGYAVRVCRRSRLHSHPPTARRLWEPAKHRLPHTPCEIATGMSHTQDF